MVQAKATASVMSSYLLARLWPLLRPGMMRLSGQMAPPLALCPPDVDIDGFTSGAATRTGGVFSANGRAMSGAIGLTEVLRGVPC